MVEVSSVVLGLLLALRGLRVGSVVGWEFVEWFGEVVVVVVRLWDGCLFCISLRFEIMYGGGSERRVRGELREG